MNRLLAQLNLSPQERRIAVIVGIVVFVVLNAVFVWPQFADWHKFQNQLAGSRKTLANYQEEIARVPTHQARLKRLESQGAAGILPAEQARDLLHTAQVQAQQAHLVILQTRSPTSSGPSTNLYFDEQMLSIDTSGTDRELIDFLVALGNGNSMIRVRNLDLRPDPPLYKLLGKIELVASYQKKPRAPVAPAPATPPAGVPARTNAATGPVRTNAATAAPARTNAVPVRPAGTNSANPRKP